MGPKNPPSSLGSSVCEDRWARRKPTLGALKSPLIWMSGRSGLGGHGPQCPWCIAWAQLLLVLRFKYSSKACFCLLSSEQASSSKLLLTFPSLFPSSVNTDQSCFTLHFLCLRVQDELKPVAILTWWLCGSLTVFANFHVSLHVGTGTKPNLPRNTLWVHIWVVRSKSGSNFQNL